MDLTHAQTPPQIGAQVWIEPGDTDAQIEGWFKTLADHHFNTGRLFIMWNYIEPQPGKWDFSLYDKAFDAAERHGINVIATLTTNRRAAHRGDFYQLHASKLEDNRSKGFEVNEWSMLDFHSRPTERLTTAGEIARVVEQNADVFANAKVLDTPVTILLSLETMTAELYKPDEQRAARSGDAHTLSAYGYYKTLLELGIPARVKHMDDFDWENQTNHLAIAPHAIAITERQAERMTKFVENGNRLLVSGLTGMIDESSESWVQRDWPLRRVMGANFKDCRLIGDRLVVTMTRPEMELPGVYWAGEIESDGANVIGTHGGRAAAVENRYGKGRAIFVPTTLGLAAWLDDNQPLADFLTGTYADILAAVPVRFAEKQNDAIMQTMRSGQSYLTMITNGTTAEMKASLIVPASVKARILWGNEECYRDHVVSLGGRETAVLLFEMQASRNE
jgi:beta-galactosidase